MKKLKRTKVSARLYLEPFVSDEENGDRYLSLYVCSMVVGAPDAANGGSMRQQIIGSEKGIGQLVWQGHGSITTYELVSMREKLVDAARDGMLPGFTAPRERLCEHETLSHCLSLWVSDQFEWRKQSRGERFRLLVDYGNRCFLTSAVKQIAIFARALGLPTRQVMLGRTIQETYLITRDDCFVDPAQLEAVKNGIRFMDNMVASIY